MSRVPVRRALISVSDKTGIVDLARGLVARGVEIVSSGGTARALTEAGIEVRTVAEVTGHPEILGGRVKTLHPRIHGAILADLDRAEHRTELEELGIEPFQLVVVNLYPFSETVARHDVDEAEAIETIDIGGPTLLRAAAKNHRWVGVVTHPKDYPEVLAAIDAGGLDDDLRHRLARAAFFHTAAYDAAIVEWLEPDELPEHLVIPLRRHLELRYGENPHQPGAAYREERRRGWWVAARQWQGKDLSFNNLVDAEAAWRLVWEFERPAAVIVKHTNPCGVAIGDDIATAFARAWECDPLSAFGGIVTLNRPLDAVTAAAIAERFVEVVVVPQIEADAREVLFARQNLRLLEADRPAAGDLDMRRLDRGFVAQTRDRVDHDPDAWQVVSRRSPTRAEWADLVFAWRVAAHTKSNAVVIARSLAAVGVGAGDQSRVGAAERAVRRAGERARGAVAASDAFFPFRDGLDVLAEGGVTAVIEPGGSRRDPEVIAAADERDIALVFTGTRHFRH